MEEEASSYRAKARDEVPDGSDERGLAYINNALATLPDSPRLLINRAYFDLAMGDVTATEVDACTALALDPEFAEAYYWRAMARCESGYIIGAAADMRTCLEKLQGEDLKRVAQQELDYIEVYIFNEGGAAAAEASAAREAQAIRLANDAKAEAAFLRWQRYSQLLISQRAAVPAQEASPLPCAATHTAEAACSEPSSLPDEAATPPAVEDVCAASSLRIEASSKKTGTPPDSPRTLVNGLRSEPSTASSGPGTPSDDSSASLAPVSPRQSPSSASDREVDTASTAKACQTRPPCATATEDPSAPLFANGLHHLTVQGIRWACRMRGTHMRRKAELSLHDNDNADDAPITAGLGAAAQAAKAKTPKEKKKGKKKGAHRRRMNGHMIST
ncbi:hypothetical protein WJX75_003591 [Coccomyxa subellipsoidea]|uniref:Uncharacterized protein n=1 Tax=Coccomyxa subellipsoidea TaxID=248742 RepID=A0ABR2Z338_9CHLO